MRAFVPLIALLSAYCSANEVLHAKWSSYKAEHGKTYSLDAEAARLETFSANLRLIDEHNQKFARGEVSYELGMTPLTDMSEEEIRSNMFGAVVDESARAQMNVTDVVVMPNAPQYSDWRRVVTKVKHQQQCGSCYTFSAAAAIESALMRRWNLNYDLSEQEFVDCTFGKLSWNFNFGCGGGDAGLTMEYALKQGISQEHEYPYVSGTSKKNNQCRTNAGSVKLNGMKIVRVPKDENALASALATHGPIAVTLNGENNEFYNYRGGIYNNPACSTQINHAVLLVGHGRENNQDYWVIKNSWGDTWGENGFMKIAKGFNRCGIISQDSFGMTF